MRIRKHINGMAVLLGWCVAWALVFYVWGGAVK